MISHKSNEELITSIRNGKEESLFALSKRFFQSSRRWLRRKGISDSATPAIFAKVLVKMFRDIQQNRLSSHVDLDKYIFNMLNEHLSKEKESRKFKQQKAILPSSEIEREVVASCFTILDEQSKKLLSARYTEKLTFEEIAVRFDFSNPVIAEFEIHKALNQFRQISQARLNTGIQSWNDNTRKIFDRPVYR